MKRVILFLATNFAIMAMLTIVWQVIEIFVPELRGSSRSLTPLLVMCLFWGMGGSFISLQLSRWMAKMSMGVQLVDGATGNSDLDWLHETVSRLARDAGLPQPEIGVYQSPEVNAFATGPSKSRALVAVSSGILNTMNREELEGVLGHELTHVANGDMVTMTLLQGVINAFVMFFARIVAWAISNSMRDEDGRESPFAGMIQFTLIMILQTVFGMLGSVITCWFSRQREFRADAGSARLAGREKMISALRKLQNYQDAVDTSHASLATVKIAGGRSMMQLFATHPALDERIRALEESRY